MVMKPPKHCTCGQYWTMDRTHKEYCPSITREIEKHKIHITKDEYDSECEECVKHGQASYWKEDE